MPKRLRTLAVAALACLLCSSAARAGYSPTSTNGWFPIVGRGPAAGNAQVRTDVWLFTPTSPRRRR